MKIAIKVNNVTGMCLRVEKNNTSKSFDPINLIDLETQCYKLSEEYGENVAFQFVGSPKMFLMKDIFAFLKIKFPDANDKLINIHSVGLQEIFEKVPESEEINLMLNLINAIKSKSPTNGFSVN